MLFNSPAFIFLFLPVTLALFFMAAHLWGRGVAIAVLVSAALIFYGQWRAWHLLVLLPSVVANYLFSQLIIGARDRGRTSRLRGLLTVSVVANLILLAGFKYLSLVHGHAADLTHLVQPGIRAFLPLGISFFTFTQITYLVDAARGRAERVSPLRYALFVTYFPHLIAGPILHHSEILPQFEKAQPYHFDRLALADGLSLFMLGLAKKVVMADTLAVFADRGFAGAAAGHVSLFVAWGSALSYGFQIYFDFSGYSDMALGLARMMRINLPINFASPYRATNISEFWRRWHITLSRFLRDYVYIPLGGNRKGALRRYGNLLITMALGGLWHGLGWTFLLWGLLHGVYLCVHRLFASLGVRPGPWSRGPFWLLTFLSVIAAWTLFRADTLPAAGRMLRGMSGLDGAYLPAQLTAGSPVLRGMFGRLGAVPWLADGTVLGLLAMGLTLTIAAAICFGTRNLYEMSLPRRLVMAGLVSPLLIQAVLFGHAPSPFIYFQF